MCMPCFPLHLHFGLSSVTVVDVKTYILALEHVGTRLPSEITIAPQLLHVSREGSFLRPLHEGLSPS
jgi:hypothetical protein